MKLFIIGNGFDKDHELPTGYDSFKNYLIEHYGKSDYLPYPEITQMPNGEEISNLKIDANIFFRLIENIGNDEYWGEFEEDLGSINYGELIDLSWNDDDNDIFRQINNNEDLARDYSKSFDNFPSLFSEWISNVKYDKSIQKIKYKKLFSNNDLYLTFNYTTLLEDIYDIKSSQICHIHGKVGNRLIFGHNNSSNFNSNGIMYGNSDIIFNIMHKKLFKDTSKCVSNNFRFLDKISQVDEIFILGWRMSTVDENYANLLKEKLANKKIVIHFTKYAEDNNEIVNYLEKINGLNYKLGKSI